MGIDVTNEDKLHLTIKSVHTTVGIEDWQGWPTITVADGLGGTQFYAPSLNLQEAAEMDRRYMVRGERIEMMIRQMEESSRWVYSLQEKLKESGKQLAQAKSDAKEANERSLFDKKLCEGMSIELGLSEARITELTNRLDKLKRRCAKKTERKNTKKKPHKRGSLKC